MVIRFCEAALKEARSRNTAAFARLTDAQQIRRTTEPETKSFTTERNIESSSFLIERGWCGLGRLKHIRSRSLRPSETMIAQFKTAFRKLFANLTRIGTLNKPHAFALHRHRRRV